MKCNEVRVLLDPLVDKELPCHEADAVISHVEACSDCACELHAMKALRSALRSLPQHSVPASLQASVLEKIRETPDKPEHSSSWLWRPSLLTHAAAACAGGFIVGTLLLQQPAAVPTVQLLSAAHVHSLRPGKLTEVRAGDPHNVKPWLAGKIDYAPVVLDLAAQGFPLMGARVDVVAKQNVAAFVYGRRDHRINLFAVPDERPGTARREARTHRGFTLVTWRHNGFRFWAIADLSQPEMTQFAEAWQAAAASN